MNIAIVGCGGIGAWLSLLMAKQLPRKGTLILYDKDIVEKRNLDRQLFSEEDIGRNKCDCLAGKLDCKVEAISEYFTIDSALERVSTIFVGADNHAARLAAIESADLHKCETIIAANEYTDAEAYRYTPAWRATTLDPRVYYPELTTDTSRNPLNPCTGEAQVADPQLAISNSMAASYAAWLWWFWNKEVRKLSRNISGVFPIKVSSNFSKVKTVTMKEMRGDT